MAHVNIGSVNAGDEFYRYKMPALQSKARARRCASPRPKPQCGLTACLRAQIEGRGNGIKTNVMNMVEVAKALGRPASCACPAARAARAEAPRFCQGVFALPRAPRRPPPLTRSAADTTKYFGTELGAQTKFEEASGLAIVNGAHETHRLSALLEGFIKRFVQCGQCNNPETEIVLTKRETIELKCKACGAVTQVDMRHKLCTFILKNPPVVKDKEKKCAPRATARAASSARSWP